MCLIIVLKHMLHNGFKNDLLYCLFGFTWSQCIHVWMMCGFPLLLLRCSRPCIHAFACLFTMFCALSHLAAFSLNHRSSKCCYLSFKHCIVVSRTYCLMLGRDFTMCMLFCGFNCFHKFILVKHILFLWLIIILHFLWHHVDYHIIINAYMFTTVLSLSTKCCWYL